MYLEGMSKISFVLFCLKDNVDEYMRRPDNDNAENVLKRLEEQHQKYKYMEYNLMTKKNR